MSWHDHHQRQAAIRAVLADAHRDPTTALTTTPSPFIDRAELLHALHYKWTQVLTGYLETALTDDAATDNGHVQAVTGAYQRAAADHPALRALLDQHGDEPALHGCRQREHRLLALSAGLAEPDESAPEITRVGSALQQLLRTGPADGPRRSRAGKSRKPRKLLPAR